VCTSLLLYIVCVSGVVDCTFVLCLVQFNASSSVIRVYCTCRETILSYNMLFSHDCVCTGRRSKVAMNCYHV